MTPEMKGTFWGYDCYRYITGAFAQLVNENNLNLRVRGSHYIIPDAASREPFFICASHTDEDADIALNAFEESLKAVVAKKR